MKELSRWIQQHNITAFFIFAFAISWTIWICVRLFLARNGVFHPLYYVGVFGPLLSAVIVTWTTESKFGLWQWLCQTFNLRINIGWYLLGGLLGPIGVALYQFSLYLLLGGELDFSEANPWWNYLISVPIGALFAGGNEEPGWRGFALPLLIKKHHPLVASLFLGIMWAVWHIPLSLSTGWGGGSYWFGWFLINTVGLSFITTWLYFKSSMSVIPVMLFHQGTNHVWHYFPMPSDVISGLPDWIVLKTIVYWTIAIILVIVTKGRLAAMWKHPYGQSYY
jgi:membrane protease YdiL (CAAX protease family)